MPSERFYWSLVLILYFGIPITVVILSYIGLVSSVNEIRQSIILMGRRNSRDGSGFQKTIIFVIGGFILCWAPTIFLQVSQVTGLSGYIFRTENFCNNFKEFAKERMLIDLTSRFLSEFRIPSSFQRFQFSHFLSQMLFSIHLLAQDSRETYWKLLVPGGAIWVTAIREQHCWNESVFENQRRQVDFHFRQPEIILILMQS